MFLFIFLFLNTSFFSTKTIETQKFQANNLQLLQAAISQTTNQNGVLQKSFNSTGFVSYRPSSTSFNTLYSIAIQNDGKVIMAGMSILNGTFRFSAIRIIPYNGQLDFSFGTNGVFISPFLIGIGATTSEAYCCGLQSDGKIILAGNTQIAGENYFALLRLTQSGQVDTTFANGTGYSYIPTHIAGAGTNDIVTGLAIQPDNKIILSGYSNNFYCAARYTVNGELDTTFGTNGSMFINTHFVPGGTADKSNAIGLQSDGKIILAGISNDGGITTYFSCARILKNGLLDTTFGNNQTGYTFLTPTIAGGVDDVCNTLIIQNDDSIILAGRSSTGVSNRFALAKYLPNGTLDTSFGINGKTFLNFNIGGANDDQIFTIQNQYPTKIIVGGFGGNGFNQRIAFARFYSNGFLDTTFGDAGTKYFPNGLVGGNESCVSLALASNNNIFTGIRNGNNFILGLLNNLPTQKEFQQQYYGKAGLIA